MLVVLDKSSPSCDAAILEPLRFLDPATTAVLAPPEFTLPETFAGESVPFDSVSVLPETLRSVLSLGAYLPLSETIAPWAAERDIPFFLVQHGLLTPWSPPASEGARVLAWSDADADVWAQGRPDVDVQVVGSQLLWSAAAETKLEAIDERPVVLGQLHGTELGRREALTSYLRFARDVPSDYRPHPNEADLVSRGLHRLMRQRGVTFETSGRPLLDMRRPVVSIFSTGTLEAATRGLPAWVTHPNPPPWVRDFWARYDLAPWGEPPTKGWPQPGTEPAAAVAAALETA
ncbi:prephenate dehydrogenase [Dermacoccus barathri]|uniref:prephenate dehydrogenase n=1 Tax=Dermacoccus barathri TaxID=322601 RepID=UPI001879661F|nr:prephenate dehydrogenase [Dermacoccus barathri]MBE7370838.1 prephenate dehydrogenase [Dermacoccus barathri]